MSDFERLIKIVDTPFTNAEQKIVFGIICGNKEATSMKDDSFLKYFYNVTQNQSQSQSSGPPLQRKSTM